MIKLNDLTTENWNSLVNKVGDIADNTQNQLQQVQSQLELLNSTLLITNVILAIIGLTYIVSTILKFNKSKKK